MIDFQSLISLPLQYNDPFINWIKQFAEAYDQWLRTHLDARC